MIYSYDLTLTGSVEVPAASDDAARKMLQRLLTNNELELGRWQDGDTAYIHVNLEGAPDLTAETPERGEQVATLSEQVEAALHRVKWSNGANHGYVARCVGKPRNAMPWAAKSQLGRDWFVGWDMANEMIAIGVRPIKGLLPIYTIQDVAATPQGHKGYKVTYARLGANWTRSAALSHAANIEASGRKARVVEINIQDHKRVMAGDFDTFVQGSPSNATLPFEGVSQ